MLFVYFFSACSNTPRNVSFPAEETEFTQPVTVPFELTEPQKIKWVTANVQDIKPVITTKFNINILPSRPIDLGGFKPFLKPIAEKKLDWENLPDTVFSTDSLPTKTLKFRTSVLGQPKRVKSSLPTIKEGAIQNIFTYGFEQGLPITTAQGLLQDKNGMMWFGTANGLCRFDGEYCDIYSMEQGLSSGYIKDLFEDSKGRIWIAASGGGIDLLEPNTATLKHLGTAQGLSNKYTLSFLEDKNGKIWVGTDGGVNIIDEKTGTLRYLGIAAGMGLYNGNNFLEDREGKIWIAANCGVIIIDEEAGRLKRLSHDQGLGAADAKCLFEDRQGKIWIGLLGGGVNLINQKTGTIQYLNTEQGLSHNEVWSIIEDDLDKIWIGTSGAGINVIDVQTESIKHLATAQGLGSDLVNRLIKDNHGRIWASTFGSGGVNVVDESTGIVAHHSASLDLNFYAVSGLMEDSKERIWVGSWGNGADVINPKTGLFTYLSSNNGLVNNAVLTLMEDNHNNIWVGTHGGGVQIIDEKKGISKCMTKAQGLSDDFISCLLQDGLGQIWIGTENQSITVLRQKTKTIKYLGTAQGLGDYRIVSLLLDSRGHIWIGTAGGLSIIDPKAETIRHIKSPQNFSNTFAGCLFEDSYGRILIGIAGGLAMVDVKAGLTTNFFVSNGLSDMSILGLGEKEGKIFVGTNKGLSVISPTGIANGKKKWIIKRYGIMQGFPHIEFGCATSTAKGKVWFATGKGVTIMDEPKENSLISPAYITGIDIMNKPQYFAKPEWIPGNASSADDTIWSTSFDTFYLKGKFPADTGYLAKNKISWSGFSNAWFMPTRLTLPYDQNHLTLYFTGTHLGDRDKTRYRYIMEGNDKAWSDITDQPFADYRNLLPGNYTFKVCSKGFNGLWSDPVTLSFTITPPWWFTWWAYSLYAFLGGIVVYTIFRNRIRQLENKQAAQIKTMVATQEEERKRISRDLHDDVGTKLSALKLFLSALHEKATDSNNKEIKSLAQSSQQFITEAMQDVRQLLLNLSPTVLEDFGYTTAVEGLVNKINETKQINFNLVVFGMKQRLQKDYELALYRITQELINNVLKHAEAKHVSLQIGQRDEKIILMMEDDGKGFDLNTHKEGYGLNNLAARTKLMQGVMIIDSKVGEGTSVLIEIPYIFNNI